MEQESLRRKRKSREYKRKKDSENRAKNGGNRNSYPAEAMASFKTASDVRTVSDRSNRTSGADPDDVYDRRLSGRAYARDIRSCISNRQSGGDPGSLETVQKDEGMFPKPENGGVRQRQPPVFCWL